MNPPEQGGGGGGPHLYIQKGSRMNDMSFDDGDGQTPPPDDPPF
jgi:hypothetical protein